MEESRCYELLRRYRWPQGPSCQGCHSHRITGHSRSRRTPRRRYLCLDCRHTFSDFTGTIFARSNLPLSTWFRAMSLLSENMSTVEYARALSVKWETARRLHRILQQETRRPGLVRDLWAAVISETGRQA